MDTENIPQLTATHTSAIAKAVIAHRPEDLIETSVSIEKVHLAAVSRDGYIYGTWRLKLDGSAMLLQVVIGDVMYAERLTEEVPYRFDRILNGLRLWAKAVNAEELKDFLSQKPHLRHLRPEHTMDPSDYSPIGGM